MPTVESVLNQSIDAINVVGRVALAVGTAIDNAIEVRAHGTRWRGTAPPSAPKARPLTIFSRPAVPPRRGASPRSSACTPTTRRKRRGPPPPPPPGRRTRSARPRARRASASSARSRRCAPQSSHPTKPPAPQPAVCRPRRYGFLHQPPSPPLAPLLRTGDRRLGRGVDQPPGAAGLSRVADDHGGGRLVVVLRPHPVSRAAEGARCLRPRPRTHRLGRRIPHARGEFAHGCSLAARRPSSCRSPSRRSGTSSAAARRSARCGPPRASQSTAPTRPLRSSLRAPRPSARTHA